MLIKLNDRHIPSRICSSAYVFTL